MKSKLQVFPMMIIAVVAVFGFKSYDFAMGLGNEQETPEELAVEMSNVATAAGQEAEEGEVVDDGIAPEDIPPVSYNANGMPYTGQEIEMLQRLAERREELDQRERDMEVREKLLIATENNIDDKIERLKNIEAQIRTLVEQHDAQEQAQIQSLVQTYTAMKPKDAANIFNTLDMEILIAIIEQMNPKKVADVLAKMNTASANQITVELATRKKLPNIEG
ncbi:MotE family protein [Pseudemcibacter aquimaris]|uniref:MotE family protein n=1 Tax=Pseudemcibacter aquimaris TaxID=2857064 RepID=UPI002011E081|nr:hypothetical protein [Pseudemcibacter aquimaris]MCC3860817.1 hypothetical protein [Pseudemcibacter aquimaris]WDU59637.1 hypothetical protein KW060_05100 [Pseudemcibacter aquimaris]